MSPLFVLTLLTTAAVTHGRVVTLHDVITPSAVIVHQSQQESTVHQYSETTESTTVYVATTTPTTIATGYVLTTTASTKLPPVTQVTGYSTTQLTETIDPDSYTTGFTIVNPPSSQGSSVGLSSTSGWTETSPTSIGSWSSTFETSAYTSSPESSSVDTASYPATTESTTVETSSTGTSQYSTEASTASIETSTSFSSVETSYSEVSTSPTSVETSSAPASSSYSEVTSSASSSSGGGGYYSGVSLFSAVATDSPPSMFQREDIPLDLPQNVKRGGPIQTNKFFANLLLNGQNLTSFTQPYGVWWSNQGGYFGLGVSATNVSQRVFGPDASANPVEYYTNPLMLKSLVLSADEFTVDNMQPSVTETGPFHISFSLGLDDQSSIQFPIVIGMGLVTGVYSNLTPRLFSQIGIQQVVAGGSPASGIRKWQATLANGIKWNIYVSGASDDFDLNVKSDFEVVGSEKGSDIVIQVGVVPDGADSLIDSAAGAYAVSASIGGEVNGDSATYRISYDTKGTSSSGKALLYALPHQCDSFSANMHPSGYKAYSPSKGWVEAVVDTQLEMVEQLYTELQWLPYQENQTETSISSDELQLIAKVVNDELSEDITSQTTTTSTYTAGKGFDKFAYILLVAHDILGSDSVTEQGLSSLKSALEPWLSNQQETPLIYDTLMKGVTSSAANEEGGSPNDDYGSPFYNDHHFHYGYMVHTAAVVAKLDKEVGNGTWIDESRDWVNSLVRDVANPSSDDTYFPIFRMFDFYHGHSWAAGMFESGDGKNEESTSEDYNFAYGMKLWGQVTGDKNMEARGDLMLAIMHRTLDLYFLYRNDNSIQPSNYIENRVAGISYENKLDHTTFFGTNTEYIQGIQMLPLTPASGLIRRAEFVKQEWDSKITSIINSVDSGWTGVLRANQALFDPDTSYSFFAQDGFKTEWLDGGASRSWYLTLAASLKGK